MAGGEGALGGRGARLVRRIAERRFLALFASLGATLLLYPFLEGGRVGEILLNALFTVVLLSAIYGAGRDRRRLLAGALLAAPWLAASWSYALVRYEGLFAPGYLSVVAMNAFAAWSILSYIARAQRVTADVLYGAVSVYMLIGVTFGFLFAAVEYFSPGSFHFSYPHAPGGGLTWSDFLYFSFVSLTSTGYGDAAPVASHARSLAIAEMIAGMMYPAVLIARLVGLYEREERPRT